MLRLQALPADLVVSAGAVELDAVAAEACEVSMVVEVEEVLEATLEAIEGRRPTEDVVGVDDSGAEDGTVEDDATLVGAS